MVRWIYKYGEIDDQIEKYIGREKYVVKWKQQMVKQVIKQIINDYDYIDISMAR